MDQLPKFPQEEGLTTELKQVATAIRYEKLFIGQQVKKLRRRLHIKQSELANRIGTSQSAVARIENGRQNLTLEMLVRLGAALGKKIQIKF